MTETITVIIKEPGEPVGRIEEIRNELKAFQKVVGGYIEAITIADGSDRIIVIRNEEGKLRGLPENFWVMAPRVADVICGTAIICGDNGEDFADCPIELDTWQRLLKKWEAES